MFAELYELTIKLIDFVLHVDVHLAELSAAYGPWLYLLMFVIIFAETGLVVTPFLPGDSLLFALGALTSIPDAQLNVHTMAVLLMIAAIVGDNVNYSIGRRIGPKVFKRDYRWLKREHLLKTEEFYVKYGARAIVLARFVPIVRTFVPFIAGVGKMNMRRFMTYNIVGAILWVNIFLYLGHFFGNMPIIKRNFSTVILAVIFLSVLPILIEFFREFRRKRRAGSGLKTI
jgi:membrane-associated protein